MTIAYSTIDELAASVCKVLDGVDKIQQIKFLRNICPGLGLRQAKEVMDTREKLRATDEFIIGLERALSVRLAPSDNWSEDQRRRFDNLLRQASSM